MDNYEIFYQENSGKLFAYLMRMTGDYHLSSDIMQEGFTRFFERYSADSRSVSLLFTIARNALFDHTRKQRRTTQMEDAGGNPGPDQEQFLMAREEYRRVLVALKQLDPNERDILSLAVSSDLSYREIAAVAGISEANVKVKIHRARLKLKTILNMGDT